MIKQIKRTNANGIKVSTIQLLDPYYNGQYETIVFDTHHTFERRAGTFEEAMKDHAAGIEYAKGLK